MQHGPTTPIHRRQWLVTAGGGAGALALTSLLQPARAAGGPDGFGRAKRVIWLFMHGGPSQVDLLDPKPELVRLHGKPLPESFGEVMTRRKVARNPLLGPIASFRPRGRSGLEISDLLPEIGECADDLCVIRSLHGDSVNHPQSVYQMNTGSIRMGRPSVGSWAAYGLGAETDSLPAFVVMPDPGGGLKGGPPAWGAGFLPARHQGVPMRAGETPVVHLRPPEQLQGAAQQHTLEFLQQLNRRHWSERNRDDELEARIRSYELAFRMQAAAPELVDLSSESPETERLYGLDQPRTREFGRRCLLGRRMLERGVRFVQLYSGDTLGWDAHKDVTKNHGDLCGRTDRPVAGLLKDLKRRGMLDDTLVIWGGEFGRMPMSEQGKGRDHNPWGYSVWMAGAGVRGGACFGATDDVGLRAAEDKVHIHDFHATILHLLGLDPHTFSHTVNGLDERLIGPGEARVVQEVLA